MSNALIPVNNYEILDPTDLPETQEMPVQRTPIGLFVLMGVVTIAVFIGGLSYWAVTSKIDGAVVAPASFVVEGNKKTVQHLDGGIVNQLLVTEGDYVEANQVLIRMDSTDNDVNLDVLGSQYTELTVRRARLVAELDEQENFRFIDLSSTATGKSDVETLKSVFTTQKKLFDAQKRARLSEKEILDQRIASLEREIEGIEQQRASNTRQLEIAKSELVTFEDLFKKGLTQISRVNGVKREIERLRGLDASFVTSQARSLNEIGELRLTGLGQQKLRKESVTTELAAIEAQIASIEPQYIGALQRQKRIEITAPVSGKVVNMSIYTKGGVIRPGEPILDIVPNDEELVVEAKVDVNDIEKLYVGQSTRIRLTAFDQAEIPEATGMIVDLSADSIVDERSGASYFLAKIRMDTEQEQQVTELQFVPGMPADVFVNTGERTAFSYLMQPLNDRIARTFIE